MCRIRSRSLLHSRLSAHLAPEAAALGRAQSGCPGEAGPPCQRGLPTRQSPRCRPYHSSSSALAPPLQQMRAVQLAGDRSTPCQPLAAGQQQRQAAAWRQAAAACCCRRPMPPPTACRWTRAFFTTVAPTFLLHWSSPWYWRSQAALAATSPPAPPQPPNGVAAAAAWVPAVAASTCLPNGTQRIAACSWWRGRGAACRSLRALRSRCACSQR